MSTGQVVSHPKSSRVLSRRSDTHVAIQPFMSLNAATIDVHPGSSLSPMRQNLTLGHCDSGHVGIVARHEKDHSNSQLECFWRFLKISRSVVFPLLHHLSVYPCCLFFRTRRELRGAFRCTGYFLLLARFFIVIAILTLSGMLTVHCWLLCACGHLLSVVTLEHHGSEIGGGPTYVHRRGIRPLGGRTGAALF